MRSLDAGGDVRLKTRLMKFASHGQEALLTEYVRKLFQFYTQKL